MNARRLPDLGIELLAEPLLPTPLVGADWPAPALRAAYDRLETQHGRLMSAILHDAVSGSPAAPEFGRFEGAISHFHRHLTAIVDTG